MDSPSRLVVSRLYGPGQLDHICHSIRLEQILIVKVVKEDVQPPFCIVNLGFEGRRRTSFNTLHIRVQNFIYRHGVCRYVGTVTRCLEEKLANRDQA